MARQGGDTNGRAIHSVLTNRHPESRAARHGDRPVGCHLERRIELMIPIEDNALKRRLTRILEAFFQDNTQASKLLPDGTSQRLTRIAGQRPFRVQAHFYQQARKAAKAREHGRSMTFEPHVPAE